MKIISWNVNGIRAVAKKNLFGDLHAMNSDIFCFQETKAQHDQVLETRCPRKECGLENRLFFG